MYHATGTLSANNGKLDSFEEFKRSFLAPPAATDAAAARNSGKLSDVHGNMPSMAMETISPEVLSVMLDETVRRGDGETLRLLLVEARSIGKLHSKLLQGIFERCFIANAAPQVSRNQMGNASFVLQLAHGTPGLAFVGKEVHYQALLGWLVDHGKWYQSAIVAEHMIANGYEFTGENEVFMIAAGLMKNTLGVTRTVRLLTTVVRHRRSDLSEMFSYSKMNRYSLSMGGNHSYKQNMDPTALRLLSDALLEQMEDKQWFSFGISKTLVALACASQHHDLAIRFVRQALELAELINKDSSAKVQGRLSSLADALNTTLTNSLRGDGEAGGSGHGHGNGSAESKAKHGSKSSVDILSLLRAFSQGSGVASTDSNSYRREDLESPLSQVLVDISAKLMAQQTLANKRKAGDMGSEGGTSTAPATQDRPFMSGSVSNVAFFKMYWVLCHRVNRVGNALSSSGTSERRGGLRSEAISDSYPRQKYATSDNSEASSAADSSSDEYLQQSYNQLVAFMADKGATSMTSSPAPGYHRRVFRYLCDELRLRHSVVELLEEKSGGMGDTKGVRVWKDDEEGWQHHPPSLPELLYRDARKGHKLRRFDGHPQHWDKIEDYFASLDAHTLSEVCLHTTGAMRTGYPSAEWGLLLGRCLREANAGYPAGFLKNVVTMAANRSDIYGLLEVLYANHEAIDEQTSNKESARGARFGKRGMMVVDGCAYSEDEARAAGLVSLKSIGEREAEEAELKRQREERYSREGKGTGVAAIDAVLYGDSELSATNDTPRPVDMHFSNTDWNIICGAAYHCRLSDIPQASFRDSYTEVMRLMRTAGVELEESTLRTLLRFLVFTDPTANLTTRILRKMSQDKKTKVTHIECTALAALVLRRISNSGGMPGVQLARPMYKADNWLFVYPSALSHMVDAVGMSAEFLGRRFLRDFEAAWGNANSAEGRNDLYALLHGLVGPSSPSRQRLIEEETPEARLCALKLSLYVSYLVGVHGGEDSPTSSGPAPGGGAGGTDSIGSDHAHRRAFDLLYAAESLQQEAEAYSNAHRNASRDAAAGVEEEDEVEEGEEEEQEGRQSGSRNRDRR